jgi:hypothetical protein
MCGEEAPPGTVLNHVVQNGANGYRGKGKGKEEGVKKKGTEKS